MRKKLLIFSIISFLCSASLFAQDRTVTGKVTSAEDGEGIPGVNVIIKGTSTGVITDFNGEYSVSVPADGGVLVFSFVGLKSQEVQIGTRSSIDVVMETDVTTLSEIIVSGVAANTPREKLTVSVAKVNADVLNTVPATSISGSLSGKVSGVRINTSNGTPGGGTDIQLRADNNLSVGSSPMVIMDGIIIEGGIADVNVDDVESIEVVRGASASALYGSRAGNGVIVITSKRGSNLDQGSTVITLRNEVGFQELQSNIDLATHHAFTLASDWTSAQGVYTKYDGVTYPNGYVGGFDPNIVGSRKFDDDHYMDNEFGVTKDQQDLFFKKGMNFTNYISISTRSAKSNMFLSAENNQQEGIIPNTDGYTRKSFRLNMDHNINDWLSVHASNMFINTSSNYPGSGGGIFFDIVLAEPDNDLFLTNPDGQPYYVRHNHWSNETNPLYATFKNQRIEKKRRFMSNYRAKAEIAPWLSFESSYSMENINERYESYNPYDTYVLGGTDPYGITYSEGSLYRYSEERFAQTFQNTLNFDKEFGDLIVRGRLSYLWERNDMEWLDIYGDQFEIINTPTVDNFTDANTSVSDGYTKVAAENYFAIASFDYKDKFLLDGMYRYDGSSLFGPENKWRGYYRVSGAYRITEDFDIPGIQELKIRSAYGTAGIRPDYAWQYETFSFQSGGVVEATQIGNKFLRPSNTAETEVALNVSFLEKFTFEAMYSMATTTDQFLNVPLLAPIVGFPRQWQNAGTVQSNTLEFNLGADVIKNQDLSWNMNFTFTKTEQTITELTPPPFQSGPSGLWYIKEGEVYGAIYGYDWVRSLDQMAKQLPEGTTIDDFAMNSDGYIIAAGTEGTTNEAPIKLLDENGDNAFVQIGDGNPDFFMGIINRVTYKGLTAYMLIDWKQGGDVYNRKAQWLTRDDRNGIMDQSGKADSEKKAFDYYKGFYDVNTNNAYWVEDAGFVKIRELALGYSLPKTMLEGFADGALNAVDLRFIGRNLFTFTKYSGYDAEVGTIRNPFDGTDTYPNFRNYALSLTLKF